MMWKEKLKKQGGSDVENNFDREIVKKFQRVIADNVDKKRSRVITQRHRERGDIAMIEERKPKRKMITIDKTY